VEAENAFRQFVAEVISGEGLGEDQAPADSRKPAAYRTPAGPAVEDDGLRHGQHRRIVRPLAAVAVRLAVDHFMREIGGRRGRGDQQVHDSEIPLTPPPPGRWPVRKIWIRPRDRFTAGMGAEGLAGVEDLRPLLPIELHEPLRVRSAASSQARMPPVLVPASRSKWAASGVPVARTTRRSNAARNPGPNAPRKPPPSRERIRNIGGGPRTIPRRESPRRF